MAVRYAGHDPTIWPHSLGIAVIVGMLLILNALPCGGRVRDLGFWPVFRFFLIPFCVASFSAFTKSHAFFLIFPMNLPENILAVGIIAFFGVIFRVAKRH